MKNTFARSSSYITIFFNSTIALCFMIFLYSHLNPRPECSSDIKVNWISSPTASYKSLRFTPNIDLSNQFTLNTKQIFLYLVVKDLVDTGKSEMVWSTIIPKDGVYKFFNVVQSNYIFTGNYLNKYEIELRGNIFPHVGEIFDVSYGKITY